MTTPEDPIKPTSKLVEDMTKSLVDKGLIIEAGWVGLSMAAIPADAPPDQLELMRDAFFAGAQHLWGSIMTMLEAGAEPTDKDLKRMDLIDRELRSFIKDYSRKHNL